MYEKFLHVHKKLTNTKKKKRFLDQVLTGVAKIGERFLVLGNWHEDKIKTTKTRLSTSTLAKIKG